MDLVIAVVLLGLLGVAAAFFIELVLERHINKRDSDYEESMTHHPAGSRCPCGAEVVDWETHQRLVHSPRVKGPDDWI